MRRVLCSAVFAGLLSAAALQAAPLPTDDAERACWLRYTAERTRVNVKEPTEVAFSNLHDGQRVRSPFLVEFAVRGMGVVPAGKVLAGTGHHHLLVNTPLPWDISQKIPFSDTHKHFGKGQTSTVLDLPPGRHKLRLLFADHDHKPHFAYSPEITVEVTAKRAGAGPRVDPSNPKSCEAWYEEELSRPKPPGEWVSITNVRDGEPVTSPFNLRFGVEGWGVCAAGQSAERTGHFLLEVLRDGRLQRTVDLANGATQTSLSLPNGRYLMRLRFVDGKTRADLLPASETNLLVSGQERL